MRRRRLGLRGRLALAFVTIIALPVAVAFLVSGIAESASQPGVDIQYTDGIKRVLGDTILPQIKDITPSLNKIALLIDAGDKDGAARAAAEVFRLTAKLGRIDLVDENGGVMISLPSGYDAKGALRVPVPPGTRIEEGLQAIGPDAAVYLWPLEDGPGSARYARLVFRITAFLPNLPSARENEGVPAVVAGVLTFVLLAVLLTLGLSRGILVPLRDLMAATRNITEGNLDFRIAANRDDEIGRLAAAFETMRERLRTSLGELEKNDADRKQMLAGISHDLRTPLTSIRGYVEGLRDGVADNPAARDRYFSVILDKTDKLERLIDGLFRLARLELDDAGLQPEIVSSRVFFEEVFARAARDVAAAGLQLEGPADLPDHPIRVDIRAIQQVVDNLVQNSTRHTPPGGVVRVAVVAEDAHLRVSVEDTGPGIPPEDLERVFDLFYRGDPARTGNGGEAGLGLAFARRVVERHGGTIRAANRGAGAAGGAVITFTLPLAEIPRV